MTEQDPIPTVDVSDEVNEANESGEDPAPQRRNAWLLPTIAVIVLAMIGYLWWNAQTDSRRPRQDEETMALVEAATSDEASRAPTAPNDKAAQPTVEPTKAPVVTASAAAIALPTVTPTLAPSEIPSRTVTFSGNATLRLGLENDSFTSTGRPVDRTIEPRTYALGGETTTIVDQWCVQLGLTSLVFDITFELNPVNGSVKTTGSSSLHDGFCDAPGPERTRSALDLEVPADASAQLVQSLQTETHLLEVSDLLNIDTGVFVELVISNTRRQ